ncbi:hypothetical protein LZ32DRAFT_441230 [Colletotrichum eremochloae]|nr:hypothetical protein LZ32DRAFT_441230 [Colletotrichum eremochloae]
MASRLYLSVISSFVHYALNASNNDDSQTLKASYRQLSWWLSWVCEEFQPDTLIGTTKKSDAIDFESFERLLNPQDLLHECISEQDAAVNINTHLLRPVHHLLSGVNLPEPLSKIRLTWEATLKPLDITYEKEKGVHTSLEIRPDIVYALKRLDEDLNFGRGEPNGTSRAFAIMEFKRKGLLKF